MKAFIAPLHPEGWRFVAIFAVITVFLAQFSTTLGWIGLILTVWCGYFFRNPKRVTPLESGLIVSPADGIIVGVTQCVPPKELQISLGQEKRYRVSIFLSVFDVHVNRIPVQGTVSFAVYHPGKFFNASLDKASEHNERHSLVIDLNTGQRLGVVQIAGLIARRIRCDVFEGDVVSTGQVYGLIRFGSRLDVYLPEDVYPCVLEGQRMVAGESILADLNTPHLLREGTKH